MSLPSLLELADSGAHFGHHRSLVAPQARPYIYSVNNHVALINLEKTLENLSIARQVIKEARDQGKTVLLVGTRRSLRRSVEEIAKKLELPYINDRWLGGFLTNFPQMLDNIARLEDLERELDEKGSKLSKSDRLRLSARIDRAKRFLESVRSLKALPDLIVLASATEDKIVLKEAKQVQVPVVAICDTDVNPNLVDYPIPANDDAPKAVKLILEALFSVTTTATPKKSSSSETAASKPKAKTEKKSTKPKAAKKVPKKVASKKTQKDEN